MPIGYRCGIDVQATPNAWQAASRPCSSEVEASAGKPMMSPAA